jgi:rhodanese-related sulfurtransferase
MKKIMMLLLAAIGQLTACGRDKFENTDVEVFAELIANTSVVVLDVRTAEEFKAGHLERAINFDQNEGDFVEKAKAQLPKDRTIAIYCRSGRRSASAASKLADEGYKLVNLKGGIMAWQGKGKQVIK